MNAALASHAASPNDSLCSASLLFPSNTSCLNIRLIEVSIKSGQLHVIGYWAGIAYIGDGERHAALCAWYGNRLTPPLGLTVTASESGTTVIDLDALSEYGDVADSPTVAFPLVNGPV